METKLFIVLLRRPRKNDPNEMRPDPFWEFGSFGRTGCHKHNLLNPNKIERLEKSRLAFVQGGDAGFKLLLITPPIIKTKKVVNDKCEVLWRPIQKPFKYLAAPTLIKNNQIGDFGFFDFLQSSKRSTGEGKFSSAFRSKTKPLDEKLAKQLITEFDKYYKKARHKDLIKDYTEALPYPPRKKDEDRRKTYRELKYSQKCFCKIKSKNTC